MAEAVEVERERAALEQLLRDAVAGVGWRGPSRDPAVIARRLVESERVRVDVLGRLSTVQVVALAERCARAETEVGRLGTLVESLEDVVAMHLADGQAAHVEGELVRERVVVLERDLRLATECRERVEDELQSAVRAVVAVTA